MRKQSGDVAPEPATARGARRERSVERDAFISYRHDPDGRVALALKQALERLAKPWYRRRALSVFLDSANLGAADDLPQRIERELMGARFLVLLACPESAASHWVTREALFWCHHKGTSHLLVAMTGGELVWDEESGGYSDASTALNADVRRELKTEAKFVDLRWARGVPELSLRLSRFRSDVADLASPIRDLAPEEIEGEDLRLHRRAIRLARAAGVAIACLAVAAGVAAAVATANERRADRRAREALGRQVGLASLDLPASDLDQAFLLSLVAADLDRGGGAERYRASRTLIGQYSRLDALLYAGAAETVGLRGVAISPDGDAVYATAWRNDGTGELVSWLPERRDDPVHVALPEKLAPSILAVGQGPNVVGALGQAMAVIEPEGLLRPIGASVVALDRGSNRAVALRPYGSLSLVDLRDGSTVAVREPSAGPIDLRSGRLGFVTSSGIVLVNADDGTELARSPAGASTQWRALAVGPDDAAAVVSAAPDGAVTRWRRDGAQLVPEPPSRPIPEVGSATRLVLSPDGRKALAVGDAGVVLLDLATGEVTVVTSGSGGFVVQDPSGRYAAIAGARLSVWDLQLGHQVFAVPKAANAFAWSGPCGAAMRCRLVSAGESIDVWEPEDLRHIELADQTNAQAVAIDADGSTVATAGWGSSVAVWQLAPTGGSNGRLLATPSGPKGTIDPSTGQVAGFDGGSSITVLLDGATAHVATGPYDRAYLGAASTRLVTARSGHLRLWDVHTGAEVPLDSRCATGRYALSPRGERLVAYDPKTTLVLVCNTATGKRVAGATSDPSAPPGVVAVDDDGTVALGGHDGYVSIVSPVGTNLKLVRRLDIRLGGESATVTALALRGGTLVAGIRPTSGTGGTIPDQSGLARVLVWDVPDGGTPVQFETDYSEVQAVALLGPEADHFVAAGRVGPGDAPRMQVWETATRRRLGRALTGLEGDPVTLGGDAKRVLAADEGGRVYEWSLSGDPKEEICAIVGRPHDRQEWNTLLGGALADRRYSPVCP